MTGDVCPESDSRLEDIRGEIALVWYKESVVLIIAVFSFFISNYMLFDLNMQFNPKIIHPLFILLFCILWFFGVFSIIFLVPYCLLSLNTQIIFWRASRIVITGTALHFVNTKGKNTYTLPFSKINHVCHSYDDDEGIRSGYPLPGAGLPKSVFFELDNGSKSMINMWFIVENDRQRFLDLLMLSGKRH